MERGRWQARDAGGEGRDAGDRFFWKRERAEQYLFRSSDATLRQPTARFALSVNFCSPYIFAACTLSTTARTISVQGSETDHKICSRHRLAGKVGDDVALCSCHRSGCGVAGVVPGASNGAARAFSCSSGARATHRNVGDPNGL